MAKISFVVLGMLWTVSSSFALPVQPAPSEESSPALQLARRVALMENDKDLPSRAMWLGKKAALSSRLPVKPRAVRKAPKKKSLTLQTNP